MARQPILSLPITYSTTSAISTVSGSPVWNGYPNEWEVEFNVTTQLHGYYVSGFSGSYDGTHVNVGDWIAVETGEAVQITQIVSATGSTVRLHVRDIEEYNIHKSSFGQGLPNSGNGFIFRTNNGLPLIDPGIVSRLAPQQFLDIKSRFGLFSIELSSLSQFDNDAGYITESSAQTLIEEQGYITEASAETAYGFSALSQFSNDAGYITEASADSAYVLQGTEPSALSQLSNDAGYITESSAQALIEEQGYITEASAETAYGFSALSQFSNDVGFLDSLEDLGAGSYLLATSANALQQKAIVGAGDVIVQDDGNNITIEVSALEINDVGVGQTLFSNYSGNVLDLHTIEGSGNAVLTLDNNTLVMFVDPDLAAYDNTVTGFISEVSADDKYILQGTEPSALSQLTNDANYITEDTATSVISQLINDEGYVSANQFVGAGIIDVTVSGTEIRISANETSLSGFITEASADEKYLTEVTVETLPGTGETLIQTVSGNNDIKQRTLDLGGDLTFNTADLNTVKISANTYPVSLSSLGAGEGAIALVSGNKEIIQKTFVGGGAIEITSDSDTITVSAPENPTNVSELNNDAGYITEASANNAFVAQGDLSALSQFNNDVDYITEQTATSVISQLVNDAGYVSANQFVGAGIIDVTVSGTEIRISANETSLDGYLTEASADTAYVAQGDLSALSQFNNDLNYVTEDTATSVISQLINDAGFVSANQFVGAGIIDVTVSGTEIRISAAATDVDVQASNLGTGEIVAVSTSGLETSYRSISGAGGIEVTSTPTEIVLSAAPNPTNVSELNNDSGYITEASADSAYVLQGTEPSALSQLTNDTGFFAEVSALGSGLSIIDVSGTEIEHKVLTAGSNILLSALSTGEIEISSIGGAVTVQDEGSILTTNATTFDFVGVNVSASNAGQDVTVTVAGPEFYEFDVNFNASSTIDSVNPVSGLPAGWTATYLNANDLEITHTTGKEPISTTYFGFTAAGGYRGISGNGSFVYTQFFMATNTTKFVLHFQSAAQALSEANSHVKIKMTF